MRVRTGKLGIIGWLLMLALLSLPVVALGADDFTEMDQRVLAMAQACRVEVVKAFGDMVENGRLKDADLFDSFYIPIADTTPQKFQTRYDKVADEVLQPLLDRYLLRDGRIVFVIVVDQNGYAPTHNSRYSRPLTGDAEIDARWNRGKRIFNDRTGLAAARNRQDSLVQRYSRDTGESMSDLSVPLNFKGRHWGAVRIGYLNK